MEPPNSRANVHLKVSQVASACAFCKARKIKCDTQAPCGACIKFNRTSSCSLAGAQSRDYVTYLRRKIRRLKADIELRPQGSSGFTSNEYLQGFAEGTAESPEIHPPSAIETLLSDIGTLPIAGPSHNASKTTPSFATLMLAAASQKSIPPAPSEFPTVAEIRQQLPSYTAARKLAEHYLTDIYPRLPFFSTPGFWAQFDHVYGFSSQPASNLEDDPVVPAPSRGESSLNQGQISPRLPPSVPNPSEPVADSNHGYDIFTVAIVLAISASSLSSSSTSVIYGKANSLFQTAICFRESISFANTVAGVQSILFLIQFANLNPSSLDAWYLIGVGMRTCIDLGLHQDPQPPSSVSPSLLETRRRIWWSMYSFDRSMSLSCCRPMEVSDNVITAHLPTFRIGLVSENQAKAVSGYLQRYRILQIQSLIYDRLNEQCAVEGEDATIVIRDLAEKLEKWSQNNSSADSTGLVRHELLMGKMLLYRPCRLIPDRALYELEELWRSVLAFAQIYRALAASNSLFYVRIASEKAYWTGLAMLFCYWRLAHHPHTSVLLRPSELWTATRDVSFVLQALSERWSQGKVLYSRFEDACTRVIKATEPDINGENRTAHDRTGIPEEVRSFCNYSSLTSIWTAGREKGPSDLQVEELRDLALTLEGWQET